MTAMATAKVHRLVASVAIKSSIDGVFGPDVDGKEAV